MLKYFKSPTTPKLICGVAGAVNFNMMRVCVKIYMCRVCLGSVFRCGLLWGSSDLKQRRKTFTYNLDMGDDLQINKQNDLKNKRVWWSVR